MLPAVIHEWVLELKALCDMTSTGTSIGSGHVPDTLLKGLEQVIGYKFHLHALNSALCCYDMLKDDAGDDYLFSPLAKDASTQSVQLWRWFLFRATNASRQAKGYLTHASERE
jgi:hypothetical protein